MIHREKIRTANSAKKTKVFNQAGYSITVEHIDKFYHPDWVPVLYFDTLAGSGAPLYPGTVVTACDGFDRFYIDNRGAAVASEIDIYLLISDNPFEPRVGDISYRDYCTSNDSFSETTLSDDSVHLLAKQDKDVGAFSLFAKKMIVSVEDNDLRYTLDGNLPSTSGAGHLLAAGDYIVLHSYDEIKDLKYCNAVAGSNATLKTTVIYNAQKQ